MKIIFYNGIKGTITDKCISLWTWSKYSHLEIVGDDGYCYSSSSRDGGVRRKLIDYNDDHWDVFEIDIDMKTLIIFYEETKHAKYDWMGIFLYHFIPLHLNKVDKWYCSEWVAELLIHHNQTISTHVTPGKLFNILNELKLIRNLHE